jgi:alpha-1,2-mannosyltransferase
MVLVGALVAGFTIYANAKNHNFAFDFRGGEWVAGRDVLAGRSPYPAPDPAHLVAVGNAYIPPPLLAVLSVPLSLLPMVPAVIVLDVVSTAALALALRIVGVRDWRVYGLALTSFPCVSTIVLGQPDGLLALGVALAWRYRSSWRGAVAGGLVIALKLLAWPLLLWLVVTRRFRQAGVAAAVAIASTLGSWSLIGVKGLSQYPRLLSADATAFEARSRSVVAAAVGLGTTAHAARIIALLVAAAIAVIVWRLVGDRDLGAFSAALAFGLLSSPILWMHYLVLLFAPLAVARKRADAVWLLTIAYWISPTDLPAPVWKIVCVLAVTATLSVLAARRPRPQAAPQPAKGLPQALQARSA